MCVCVRECVFVYVSVPACVCASVRACVCVCLLCCSPSPSPSFAFAFAFLCLGHVSIIFLHDATESQVSRVVVVVVVCASVCVCLFAVAAAVVVVVLSQRASRSEVGKLLDLVVTTRPRSERRRNARCRTFCSFEHIVELVKLITAEVDAGVCVWSTETNVWRSARCVNKQQQHRAHCHPRSFVYAVHTVKFVNVVVCQCLDRSSSLQHVTDSFPHHKRHAAETQPLWNGEQVLWLFEVPNKVSFAV